MATETKKKVDTAIETHDESWPNRLFSLDCDGFAFFFDVISSFCSETIAGYSVPLAVSIRLKWMFQFETAVHNSIHAINHSTNLRVIFFPANCFNHLSISYGRNDPSNLIFHVLTFPCEKSIFPFSTNCKYV